MATHTGTNGGNSITLKNKTALLGYTATGSGFAPLGDFSDAILLVNTLDATGGTDTVDFSGLTAASGVTSVTVNGGGGTQNNLGL